MSSWHIKDLLALLLLGSIVPDLSVSQGNKNPCTYTNIFHKKLGLILSWIGCIFVNKKPVWSECNHGEYTHKNTAPVTKQELQEEISFGVCNGLLLGQTHSFSSSSSSFPAPHIYNVLNSSKPKVDSWNFGQPTIYDIPRCNYMVLLCTSHGNNPSLYLCKDSS
jgi:hypothetical protein